MFGINTHKYVSCNSGVDVNNRFSIKIVVNDII